MENHVNPMGEDIWNYMDFFHERMAISWAPPNLSRGAEVQVPALADSASRAVICGNQGGS